MFFPRNKAKKSSSKQASSNKSKTQANFEQKWLQMQEGIGKLIVYLDNPIKRPYDNSEHAALYSIVYDLCTQKVDTGKNASGCNELLYERYQNCVTDYLKERVVSSLKQKQGETLLSEAVKRWRDHCILIKWLTKVFAYLDRYFTKHNNRDSLKDVGMKCYQNNVYTEIKDDMATALLDKILQERNGEKIDRSMMKDGVNLFVEMGLGTLEAYEQGFEVKLLKDTSDFYKRESAKWINEDSVPEYMKKTEKKLEEELQRSKAYLHTITESSLIKKVEKETIEDHSDRLMNNENSGFVALLKQMQKEDLHRMYLLFKRVDGLRKMSDTFKEHVVKDGLEVIKKHEERDVINSSEYVNDLLNLHEKYSNLVNIEFEKDSLFLEALRDAFTNFVNKDLKSKKSKRTTHTSAMLSSYCDGTMKTADKKKEQELSNELDNIVKLFAYISDKDIFLQFYQKQLSRRLLMLSNLNIDAEKDFISKLKLKCGANFTQKIEGMIKDKNTSADLQKEFSDYAKKSGSLPFDFAPKVLTQGYWPNFSTDKLNNHSDFKKCVDLFKQFYDNKTSARVLIWINCVGTCTLTGKFAAGSKQFEGTQYQTSILLLFNENKSMKVKEIVDTLNLPLEETKKSLLPLIMPLPKEKDKEKTRVLVGSGDATKLDMEDTITLNEDFKTKRAKIKFKNTAFVLTDQDKKEISQRTVDDRNYAIDAAIVRTMKARKSLDHSILVLEVIKQLSSSFNPDPKVIKKRIEDLIVREFLERDENNSKVYHYLA